MSDLAAFLHARLDEASVEWTVAAAGADSHPDERQQDALWHLRDIEAKRLILFHNAKMHEYLLEDPELHLLAAGASDRVIKLLAMPYDSHPDYRPEWAPRSVLTREQRAVIADPGT